MKSPLAVMVTLLVAFGGACGGKKAATPSPPTFSLTVDDAQLDRTIGAVQAADGHVFLDVGVTLSNLAETTPVPAAFSFYTLTTASLLVYPVSGASAGLSPSCDNVSIAAGGHLSCRIAFDIPATEVPAHVDYATMSGLHASADVTTIAPLPCGGPGLRCADGSDCCTGVCQSGPNGKTCSLIGGNCVQPGGSCQSGSALECCSGDCFGQTCIDTICLPIGSHSSTVANCCTELWVGPVTELTTCGAVSNSCATIGEVCASDGDCCSSACGGGRCIKADRGTCNVTHELCYFASDCCSGVCNRPSGYAGTCG